MRKRKASQASVVPQTNWKQRVWKSTSCRFKSVYPKFWGYQAFIYSGYCSCHCRLPSEESTGGIPLI